MWACRVVITSVETNGTVHRTYIDLVSEQPHTDADTFRTATAHLHGAVAPCDVEVTGVGYAQRWHLAGA